MTINGMKKTKLIKNDSLKIINMDIENGQIEKFNSKPILKKGRSISSYDSNILKDI